MAHCGRFRRAPLTRRQMLSHCCGGFGPIALAAMLGRETVQGQDPNTTSPFSPRPTHFPARVKHVIYLYMDGGPSQVDTFDPKPRLAMDNGKPFSMKIEPTQFNNIGTTLASPWKFQQYGESGTPVSDLFPHVAKHVDDTEVKLCQGDAYVIEAGHDGWVVGDQPVELYEFNTAPVEVLEAIKKS